MKLAPLILSLSALPAAASSAPRILDCTFTVECSTVEAQCRQQEEPILSFTLIVALEGDSAAYEGDDTAPPMQVSYTEDGVLMAYDAARGTLTSVGGDGTAVHASNLILLGTQNRAAQWAGRCETR